MQQTEWGAKGKNAQYPEYTILAVKHGGSSFMTEVHFSKERYNRKV